MYLFFGLYSIFFIYLHNTIVIYKIINTVYYITINRIKGGGTMKFSSLEGFKVKNEENSKKQEERTVKAQRSQCRTTLKRQDC